MDDRPLTDMRIFEGKMLQDKYLLESYIAGGNFGAVYKSQQHFLGIPIRRVAVKLSKHTNINLEKSREIFADLFALAEAMDEIMDVEAKKYLPQIYDAGILKEDGRMFVVMEFVQGTDLAEQFNSLKIIPSNLLLKWVYQICTALAGLHAMVPPCIHRDLKPDNILLGVDKNVRVVDFGLAARLLNKGFVPGVAGAVTYMAPETTRGESTPASDVYCLGVIMYQGLTGHLPFEHLIPPIDLPDGLYSEWLYNEKSKLIPVPPSVYNNSVPKRLDTLVLRCLEFNPAKRYMHAGALLKALDDLTKPESDSKSCLDIARGLVAEGNVKSACDYFESCLESPDIPKEIHFTVLREWGEALMKMGDNKQAAVKLVAAWDIAKDSGAILRTRSERVQFLEEIEKAFAKSGNVWQANRFKGYKEDQLRARVI